MWLGNIFIYHYKLFTYFLFKLNSNTKVIYWHVPGENLLSNEKKGNLFVLFLRFNYNTSVLNILNVKF